MPLNYKFELNDGVAEVHWNGGIDEDWNESISELSSKLTDNSKFYFTNIDTLNSIGIRLWTQFITEVSTNRTIEFYDCPSLIIRLLSISDKFLGNAKISSFFVNFDCPECESELAIRFQVEQGMAAIQEEAKKIKCRSCGSAMDYQEDPDIYEEFLQSTPK